MNYSGHYGTFYNLDDDACEKLERHGIVVGHHDEDRERTAVFVPQQASDMLRHVPEILEHPFRSGPGIWWELVPHRGDTLRAAINTDDLSLEALRGETAMARFGAQTMPDAFAPDRSPDFWSRRAERCHAAFATRLRTMWPLARLAAEGEIELATGQCGAPDQAPGAITVRVFFDRAAGPRDTRRMLIETVIAHEDLDRQLGARIASAHAETLSTPDARVCLMGNELPLEGQIAERVGRADWSPSLTHREPPLELWTIDDAIGWAKNTLPHFNFAAQQGFPTQAVLSLYQAQDSTRPERRPSLQDLMRAANALQDAKLMLEQSLDLGRHWLAQRIGHVLESEARFGLAPPAALAAQFRTKYQQYVISIDGPGSKNPRHPQPTVYWTGKGWTADLELAGRYSPSEAASLLEGPLSAYASAGTERYRGVSKRLEQTLTP